MINRRQISRRAFTWTVAASAFVPARAVANPFREISWDDLIPPGVPYSEIIADGDIDPEADTWSPVYDDNATKLNLALDGRQVKLPGYIIPLDMRSAGVSTFVLVPYVGACIHVPPPPPNQLVFVSTTEPWPSDELWDPVWVLGRLSARRQSTEIAETGYQITAEEIEVYTW